MGSDYFIIATGQQSKTSYQHLMATGNSCMYDGNTRNPLGVLEFEQLMVSVLTGAPSSVGAGNLIKRISHMFSHISSGKTSNAPTSIESSISEWGAPDTESTSPLTQNTERLV